MTNVNVLLGTNITLLNREFAVVFEKKADEGNTFLLIPTKKNVKGITLQEMKDGIKQLFGDEITLGNLEDDLNDDEKKDVTFNLTMAYLYIEIKKDNDQNEQKRKNVEFAFQVTANGLNNLLPQGLNKIFNIHDVHLAIWSTKRQKIREAMQLITPSEFLNDSN